MKKKDAKSIAKRRVRSIPGVGVSVTGEQPALGYTVGELIARLKAFPKDRPVGMSVGPSSNLEVLSLYEAVEPPFAVWFDLQERS